MLARITVMYCLFLVSFAVPFSFESVDERQALYRGASKNGYFAGNQWPEERTPSKRSMAIFLFCFVLFFCFDICMEVHYQFELAKSATFLDHQNSAV